MPTFLRTVFGRHLRLHLHTNAMLSCSQKRLLSLSPASSLGQPHVQLANQSQHPIFTFGLCSPSSYLSLGGPTSFYSHRHTWLGNLRWLPHSPSSSPETCLTQLPGAGGWRQRLCRQLQQAKRTEEPPCKEWTPSEPYSSINNQHCTWQLFGVSGTGLFSPLEEF